MCESCKPRAIKINRERLIWNAECIDTHIEFLATNQKRITDIFLNYIGICLGTPIILDLISKRDISVLWLPVGCQDHSDRCFSKNQFPWYSWRERYLFPKLFQSAKKKRRKHNIDLWNQSVLSHLIDYYRFHDPELFGISEGVDFFEFFAEYGVFTREIVCQWSEVIPINQYE